MRTSTSSPSKAERERWDRFRHIGCIVCLLRFGEKNLEYEIQHMLAGNRRLGHWYTLPLCVPHHRGTGSGAWTSIADGSKAFTKIHGTEWHLWTTVQQMLQLDDTPPRSKLVSRKW